MGYSISRKAVYSQKAHLDKILDTPSVVNEITWMSSSPELFKYRLFNAFKAAEILQIKPYDTLRKNWRIRHDKGMVTVERVNRMLLEAYKQAQDVYDILDYVAAHTNIKYPIMFPHVPKDHETLNTLYHWANKQNLYIIVTDQGIVLTKEESDKVYIPENLKK